MEPLLFSNGWWTYQSVQDIFPLPAEITCLILSFLDTSQRRAEDLERMKQAHIHVSHLTPLLQADLTLILRLEFFSQRKDYLLQFRPDLSSQEKAYLSDIWMNKSKRTWQGSMWCDENILFQFRHLPSGKHVNVTEEMAHLLGSPVPR